MGFMDKVKAGAEQAVAKGKVAAEKGLEKSKEAAHQGQEKVKEMQAKKAADRSGENADGATPSAASGDYKLDDV